MKSINSEKNKMFKRHSFYGIGIKWFGFDKFGSIAAFSSGEMPIPKIIFTDEIAHKQLNKYFAGLHENTNAKLTEIFMRMKADGNGDFLGSLKTAQKGLYAINEIDTLYESKYINGHYLVAFPEIKIDAINLPEEIRELIEPYHFPIDFSTIEKIDITQYFECE